MHDARVFFGGRALGGARHLVTEPRLRMPFWAFRRGLAHARGEERLEEGGLVYSTQYSRQDFSRGARRAWRVLEVVLFVAAVAACVAVFWWYSDVGLSKLYAVATNVSAAGGFVGTQGGRRSA